MNLPPSDFAEAYREHSVPKLRRMIDTSGWLVGIGAQTFSDAGTDVTRLAIRLGAAFLPPEHFDALQVWILASLADTAADVEAQCGG